jgi:hypothetical protein
MSLSKTKNSTPSRFYAETPGYTFTNDAESGNVAAEEAPGDTRNVNEMSAACFWSLFVSPLDLAFCACRIKFSPYLDSQVQILKRLSAATGTTMCKHWTYAISGPASLQTHKSAAF